MKSQAVPMPDPTWRPMVVWLLAATFYFSQYIVRVLPSVVQADLIQTFELDYTVLGLLGGLFYYPYIFMQTPTGILVDKFGVRILLTLSIACCALSSLLFAGAQSANILFLSRFLLGFCAAAGFVSALKLATLWFAPNKLGLIIGLTQALGMLGGASQGPMAFVTDAWGWRSAFWAMGGFFVVLSILTAVFMRNAPQNKINGIVDTKSEAKSDLVPTPKTNYAKQVLCHPLTWINAFYAGLIYAPIQVLGEYWGSAFFGAIYHIPKESAASAVATIFIGCLIGSPLAGRLSDKVGRKPVMIGSGALSTLLLGIFFLPVPVPLWALYAATFTIGIASSGLIAAYTVAGELHHPKAAGLSLAIANMFSILFGALLIPVCGFILDMISKGQLAQGLPVNEAHNYLIAMSILPVCSVLGLVFACFMKETLVKTPAVI